MPDLTPDTTHDDQHRDLARGAIVHARYAQDPDRDANDWLVTDVLEEAQLAWLATGLLPNTDILSAAEVREVCRAIIGRVATVLVMVGWTPPARLLDTEAVRDA